MLRIKVDDFDHRNSLERQRKSVALPLSIIDALSRKSFSYSKLPEEPLQLSVLKLDGSLFDIQVMQTGTVADLKQAVEAVFSHTPKKGPGKISWPHVWGHFCLCYDKQKLVTETDYIRNYGIKDGDQLQFIRHISTSYNGTKKKSKKRAAASKQRNLTLSRSTSCEEKEQYDEQDNDNEDIENGRYWHYDDKDQNFVRHHEYGMAHFLGGWFPCSRLVTGGGMICKCKASPLKFPCDLFDSFKKLIGLCSSKRYSRRDTWRED